MDARRSYPGARHSTVARLGPRGMRGAGLFSTLCVLLVVVGGAWLSIKLLPLYLEFRTIRSIVESLPADAVARQPLPAIYDALEKRFLVNNLQDIKPREVITYVSGPGPAALTINYERREPLFLNVDVVIRFDQRFDYR